MHWTFAEQQPRCTVSDDATSGQPPVPQVSRESRRIRTISIMSEPAFYPWVRTDRAAIGAAKSPNPGGQWQTVVHRITGLPGGRLGRYRQLVNGRSIRIACLRSAPSGVLGLAEAFAQPPELVRVRLRMDRQAQLIRDHVFAALIQVEFIEPRLIRRACLCPLGRLAFAQFRERIY